MTDERHSALLWYFCDLSRHLQTSRLTYCFTPTTHSTQTQLHYTPSLRQSWCLEHQRRDSSYRRRLGNISACCLKASVVSFCINDAAASRADFSMTASKCRLRDTRCRINVSRTRGKNYSTVSVIEAQFVSKWEKKQHAHLLEKKLVAEIFPIYVSAQIRVWCDYRDI